MNQMKNLLWLALLAIAVIASSCEDFLDVDEYFDDTLKYDSVFVSRQNLERYLWGAAGQLPDESAIFGNDVLPGETATDEIFTLMTEGLFHGKALTLDLVSSSNLRGMNAWDPCYRVIRKANTVLARIGECKDITSLQRSELIGYAHFLRGYAYSMILMSYGPAVLLGDDVLDTNRDADYYERGRATFDETVDYICNELETAADFIPDDVPILNFGRPTKGAAYAMIARVRLHAASPAFNGGAAARRYFGNWKRSSDGAYYVSQEYDENKWALAAAACKRVMDMNRYRLHTVEKTTSASGDVTEVTPSLPDNVSDADFPYGAGDIDPLKSYTNMFNGTTYPVQNRELIWGKTSGSIQGFTQQSFPIFMGGYNGMCIPQKIIDEYRMRDGKTIEQARAAGEYSETGNSRVLQYFSGYRVLRGTNNMYVNREMRFYACVGYSGCYWPATSCSNQNFRQQTIYYYNGANAGRDKAIQEPRNQCITGYVLKKYIHPEDNWYNGDGSTRTSKTFPIIRYAEILLSYAEAVNHLASSHTVTLPSGQTYTLSRASNLQDALFAINQVRFRSGQPAVSDEEAATEETFDETVRHERFIEFMAEGRRYYDVRRWGILEEVENEPITGMNVESDASNYFVRTIVNHSDYRNRTCDRKMVLLPLERNEVRKSKSLDQNPGW
ncbi:MAG: RagB/SusD family nutrient uptake outer membrane protein [Muribaculaceae bacterium]|nr:RagB/SusD family nutrient uptake outer membrane protein [Muribaculaceae bacterium]